MGLQLHRWVIQAACRGLAGSSRTLSSDAGAAAAAAAGGSRSSPHPQPRAPWAPPQQQQQQLQTHSAPHEQQLQQQQSSSRPRSLLSAAAAAHQLLQGHPPRLPNSSCSSSVLMQQMHPHHHHHHHHHHRQRPHHHPRPHHQEQQQQQHQQQQAQPQLQLPGGRPAPLPLLLQQQRPSLLSALLPRPLLHQQHQQQVRGFVLMPRRIKYRKAHKHMGFNETICPNTRQLAFGLYGIRAMEHCRIRASTLEAVRRTMRRILKKSAMMWIRVTPSVPVTSKPAEVRMGKGKGAVDYWAAPIRPGQVIFEMDRCSRDTALAAMQAIQAKMPIKVGFLEWS